MKLAFISRHTPTPEQYALANAKGHTLIHVGDCDAESIAAVANLALRLESEGFDGAVVAHVGLALDLAAKLADEVDGFTIGCFINGSRPLEGGKPTFYAKALHIWRIFGGASMGVFPCV